MENEKTGIKPYKSNLVAFKNKIQEELEKIYNEKTAQKKKGEILKYPAKIYADCCCVYFIGIVYDWRYFLLHHAGRNT